MDACFCSALMASPDLLFVSAHPDPSIIVFVNVSSKTSSSSTQQQANDIHMAVAIHSFFFYKNLFYKNVEAEIDPNFKNVLRTFLRLRVD